MLLVTVASATLLGACASSGPKTSARGAGRGSTTTATTAPAPTTAAADRSGADWVTYFHDASRTAFTSDAPAAPKQVHRRWRSPRLDGDVYAEPLLAGRRVIVATENDSVYSLDVSSGAIAWRTHLADPVPASSLPCGNVDPVGITGTPVVDRSTSRIYVVGMVRPAAHKLFELDLATGHLVASKVVDVPGADPLVHNQRSALTLSRGMVDIPFGGRFGDCGDYHGRVTSVRVAASGLGAMTTYTLPTQSEGGFWAPPGAATAADGSLYLASGNSSSSTTYDYGNSVVRLSAGLKLLDSFAPANWKALNATDGDIGSSGPVLLPAGRIFQIGKSGVGYLLDAAHLGGIGGALYSAPVCGSGVWGAVGHNRETLFVPCSDGVERVTVAGDRFAVGWKAAVSTPGPPIVTPNAIWCVETGSGNLVALNPSTGASLISIAIGTVPSRFTVPAAGARLVLVAADRSVSAFGD